MIKIYVVLASVFIIGLFSATAFSQCPSVLIPPDTNILVGGGGIYEFELERNKAGTNSLIFYSDGSLKYNGRNLKPAITVANGVKKFMVYEKYPKSLAIPISKNSSSKVVTTFYILDTKVCTSKKVIIDSINLDKVVWDSENKSDVFLCEAEGRRFAQVDTKTGKALIGKKSRNSNPCNR